MSELNNNEKLIVDFLLENQRITNKQAIEITEASLFFKTYLFLLNNFF
jgi:hypothetical protein